MRSIRYLLFVVIVFLLAFCRTSRPGRISEPVPVAAKDSIVFISMKMWHDSLAQSNHIEVLEVLTKAGSLKRPFTDHTLRENYLKCITWDKKTGERDSFLIEHPLYKDVEAVSENNQLSMKRLSLKEAQFFVRFQKKRFHTLVIQENASAMKVKDRQIKEIKF